MTMLLDNKTQGKVGEVLAESIGKDAKLSMLSSLFSIYGYASLREQLSKVASVRLLLPSNAEPPGSRSVSAFRVAGLDGTDADRRFRNTLNIGKVAEECTQWLEQKAEIRAVTSPAPQNLFHVANDNGQAVAIHGSSPFTTAGLGVSQCLVESHASS